MKKYALLSTLFKWIFGLALISILSLLYWSSLLVEENLREVKTELIALQENLSNQTLVKERVTTLSKNKEREHIDPSLPNVLTEDPFYESTLPKLLGANFKPSGIRQQATIGKPNNLHPFSPWAHVNDWLSVCTISFAKNKFGFYETYCPSAAIKVEERPSQEKNAWEYWIHLREGIVWQPLKKQWFPGDLSLAPHFFKSHPLTAYDFKLYFDLVMNPFITEAKAIALRQFYDDIIEIKVLDDLTLVVKWKTYPIKMPDGKTEMRPKYLAKSYTLSMIPLASFVYKYYPDGKKIIPEDQDSDVYRKNSTFAQTFMQHWAKNIIPSCGPMQFDGMSDQVIRFARNPRHFEPYDCLVQGSQIQFKQTDENIWQAFKQGDLDSYSLLPDNVLDFKNFIKSDNYAAQEKKGLKIHRLDYIYRSYSYVGWNEARPLFKNKKIRQAMTMAIDRKRIIRQIANGMGIEITCPFLPYSNAYDNSIKPWPYDPHAARRILEEEGFSDLDGDGILEKEINGEKLKFEFSLTYYVKNSTTKAICEFIVTSLKEIGVKCNLNGVDIADLSAMFDDKNFDAYVLAWALPDPPEDLKQLWHSSTAKEKGSSNAIGFINPEVDRIIEALTYEYDPQKRIALYHSFDRIIHDEAPYTFLYTPRVALLYRDYLQNVFLPVDRQDLVPGATVAEPVPSIFWLKKEL